MTATLKITSTPIDDLEINDDNPRVPLQRHHTEYKQLRASIEHFGLVRPLIRNTRTGKLVGGHQRLQVLKDLKWTEAPVLDVDVEPGKEQALAVALNAIKGRWDDNALLDAIRRAGSNDIDLTTIGFTDSEYDSLLALVDAANAEEDQDLVDLLNDEEDTLSDEDEAAAKEASNNSMPEHASLAYTVRKHERHTIVKGLKYVQELAALETSAQALAHLGAALDNNSWPPAKPGA
jgi:ParB-like chromosome segregation protein Spo0J